MTVKLWGWATIRYGEQWDEVNAGDDDFRGEGKLVWDGEGAIMSDMFVMWSDRKPARTE